MRKFFEEAEVEMLWLDDVIATSNATEQENPEKDPFDDNGL